MKAAIILCGSGCFDGSEIHESTLLLLMLRQKNIDVHFYSIDKEIEESISHVTKEPMEQKRNMKEMAGRIARGEIRELKDLAVDEYDILGMPGGFGVAKNLSNFSEKGKDCVVDKDVARIIRDFYEAEKHIIGMCIAPMIIGKVLEGSGVKMTAGSDHQQLKILAEMGIEAVSCKIDEVCIDEKHKVYTVPAYMEPPDVAGIYESLMKVQEVL